MREDRENPVCEHDAAKLLPWFVVDALSESELELVQAHLEGCALCLADVQRERQVRALARGNPVVEHAPQAGLHKLMARIDEVEREAPAAASDHAVSPAAIRRPKVVRWLAAAVIVQALGLGILGAWLWARGAELRTPRFHTMSSPSASSGRAAQIRVVFAPSMMSADMQALLTSISATVTAGPSEAGVYDLALRNQGVTMDAAIAQLRANAGVTFAEPHLEAGQGQ